jgi:predicted Fe-Mo cluster-binding NifX family protein
MDTKKIAIATDDKETISKHLGRAEYFAIYTITPDRIIDRQYIENDVAHHRKHRSHDDHKRVHRQMIEQLSGCQVVLAAGMGDPIRKDFEQAGMQGYVVVEGGSIDDAVQQYIEGELMINRNGGCEHNRK